MPLLRSRMLAPRAGSFAGIFVMIAMTATIAAAVGQFMATGLGAPGAGRFAAADAVVRAPSVVHVGHGNSADTVSVQRPVRLPAAALARVAAVPGVRSAVGDVSFPLTVIGRDGRPLPTRGAAPAHGYGWPSAALTPYRLAAGSAPRAPDQVVLDIGLADAGGLHPGDRVRIVSPAGVGTFTVSGIAAASAAQQRRQSSVFLTQAQAQRLSGLGAGFDAIAVRLAPGVDLSSLRSRQLAAAAGAGAEVFDHRHAESADVGDTRAQGRVELVAVLASGGGTMLFIAIFVVAGTVAFAVEGRRRDIALLRAVGATPGQVRRRLLGATAWIGLLAGAAGCLAASALFGPFTHALISVGLAPNGFAVTPNWIPYGIGLSVGPVVALLATLVAAHRALRVRPGEALVASGLPQRRLGILRTLLGLVALGGGLTLVVTLADQTITFATLSALCFTIAVTLLAPLVIGWPAAIAGRPLLAGGGAGFLTGASLPARRFRIGAVGAAIALVVAVAGTEVVTLASAQRATQRAAAARTLANRVIVASAGGGLPPSVATAAARLPGARVAGVVSTDVFLLDPGLDNNGDSWTAAGLAPGAARGTLALDVRAGSLAAVRGNGIAVSETVARAGARLGRLVHARLADGTRVRLRVVAVYDRGIGFGAIVMPGALALAHATAALDSAVFVAGHGPAIDRGLASISHSVPTAVVESRAAFLRDVKAQSEDQARAEWVVAAMMILVAAMAAFNTGAMAAAERRREFVLARLAGATRAQVIGSVTLESLLATLAGLAAGAAIVAAALADASSDPLGTSLAVPLGQAGLVLGGAAALGLLGTLLPAAVIGRAPLTALAGLRE